MPNLQGSERVPQTMMIMTKGEHRAPPTQMIATANVLEDRRNQIPLWQARMMNFHQVRQQIYSFSPALATDYCHKTRQQAIQVAE